MKDLLLRWRSEVFQANTALHPRCLRLELVFRFRIQSRLTELLETFSNFWVTMFEQSNGLSRHDTRIYHVDSSKIGQITFSNSEQSFLHEWSLEMSESNDALHLQKAATQIRETDTPVAFPTETVYGLGADATRSSAVSAIYAAKQRPADNPLIVHVSSIPQLRRLLNSRKEVCELDKEFPDPVPQIYQTLVERFWPGPLTILLPLPYPSPLAPQVTAGLSTFAVRMPSSLLALALIQVAGVPLAAPSANTSTKPSPTKATHVLNDLSGRIDTILDGGPCEVGVESTVVDGLSNPPLILRPGGVSIEMLRRCPGWENVVQGYQDKCETGVPRAPGMKYKHYSPKARVILVERDLDTRILASYTDPDVLVGCVTTKTWEGWILRNNLLANESRNRCDVKLGNQDTVLAPSSRRHHGIEAEGFIKSSYETTLRWPLADEPAQTLNNNGSRRGGLRLLTISLGCDVAHIARGLFSALRELDEKGVDVILVEGIGDDEGDATAAVMNRLRKAATYIEK